MRKMKDIENDLRECIGFQQQCVRRNMLLDREIKSLQKEMFYNAGKMKAEMARHKELKQELQEAKVARNY